jgi:hypothetical protein
MDMPLRSSILKVLAYFDLFDYPLTVEEILFFLEQETRETELKEVLNTLLQEKCLFKLDPFYALHDNPRLMERRVQGNQRAKELLRIGYRISRFLFQFPYVRGIGISGSLSKLYADEKADIDYFVITRSNRLWIARTFMHLFKKLSFLTGRQDWYCMNYYVDENALEIKEKNIFTAVELITLLPACGNGGLIRFFDANDWAAGYLPHYRDRVRSAEGNAGSSLLKRAIEKLFDNRAGDRLDDFFRDLTSRRWQKKEERGALNEKGQRMSLQNDKHFSRPNPLLFQKKILARYDQKLKDLKLEGEWELTPTEAAGLTLKK